MVTVTVNNTPTPTMPYVQELADIPALQVQNTSIHDEYVNLTPASFFEKKQVVDNATRFASFGMLYWAHLRLGRLNGPKFYCVQGGFRR
jgi:hypothetical protein